jgi:uncharacterized protein
MVLDAPVRRNGIEAYPKDAKDSIMLRGACEIGDFILRNYSGKVVEIGTGFVPEVAMLLSQKITIVATDKEMRHLDGLYIRKDDIFSPQKELYEGASLLYSIRPPIEIQLAMGRLAVEIGADVLIRPLKDEIAELSGFSRTLVNLGDARFYLFKRVE